MTTMRESLSSWVQDNYSFCRDTSNDICGELPINTRLTMIEAASMSGIPEWPDDEDLINPIFTEFGAPIKSDLTLGTLVKGRQHRVVVPRPKDTIGIFHTHEGSNPRLSVPDVMDALIHNDAVTCVGASGLTRNKIKCFTKKDPEWSKWRTRAVDVSNSIKSLDTELRAVFRDEKTGKPLSGKRLQKLLAGLEVWSPGPEGEQLTMRLMEVAERMVELRPRHASPRDQEYRGKPGLIYEGMTKGLTEDEFALLSEASALRLKQGKLVQKIADIAKEPIQTDITPLERIIKSTGHRLAEIKEEVKYIDRPVMRLIEEEDELRDEMNIIYNQLDDLRKHDEKDKPDPAKYRNWQESVERSVRSLAFELEAVVSGHGIGTYLDQHGAIKHIRPLFDECVVYDERFGEDTHVEDETEEIKMPTYIDKYREFFKR